VIEITENKGGSVWRRWDLHIHAPDTKLANAYGKPDDDEVWSRYLDILEASPVQVFGITDYFSCGSYFELVKRFTARHPNGTKVFFLNVEFRLAQAISGKGGHPNIHVIFDNDLAKCSEQKIERFLSDLQTQSIDGTQVRTRCAELKTKADYERASVTLDDLFTALRNTFGEAKPYRIVFPANNDGVRSTDTKEPRKVALTDRIDQCTDIFFGNLSNTCFFLRDDRYQSGKSEPKPVISGSDAHSFEDLDRLSGDVAGYPATWIKADCTFDGLKQISFEPEARVFIGSCPDVMIRLEQDGTKFLKSLQIDQVNGYDERNGRWFKNVSIPLNPELTAIIGNKGSGKSAIVDIIGLLGDSRQEAHFSFLTDDSKSKKFRQKGYAENFEASLHWCLKRKTNKRLSENWDESKPESVRYLPQNYFEQLTNEIEIEQFRKEIEDVVFSHVDETDKLGKSTFADLEETKTLQSKQEISSLKRKLRELNVEIVKLEGQTSPSFRQQLEGQIDAKRQELVALDSAKPKEVPKPDQETEAQKGLAREVEKYTAHLSAIEAKGFAVTKSISELKVSLQGAVAVGDGLANLNTVIIGSVEQLRSAVEGLELRLDELLRYSLDMSPLDDKKRAIIASIQALEKDHKIDFDAGYDFDAVATLPDMRAAYGYLSKHIDGLKEQLSTPQRRHQDYLKRLAEWGAKRLLVAGSDTEPKPETLAWLVRQLRYVTDQVAVALPQRKATRAALLKNIFTSKHRVLSFYSDLKQSVEGYLKAVRAADFLIEIDASFVIDRDFMRQLLNHVNQRKKGYFRNPDAQTEIAKFIQETNWNDYGEVLAFCDGIIQRMTADGITVAYQANDEKEFYDFLFSLDYITTRYELRLGSKNLNELSPGEKGLLLLIFYLQLDRNDIPLIIDQPEDNLDNDSIFAVLARCIRDAKKRRQIVLVTHNPNLAVGADAEAVVYVKLDKADKYKFSYETGSIENPKINARIVEVLEGSQPAFVKRRLKYGIA